jgi:S-formylglutathione hydrolase FrmB
VTQQVQPADAGTHEEEDERPGERRARRRGRPNRRDMALLLAGLWLVAGIWGAISYGHDYYTYRGFPPPKTPAGVSPGRVVNETFFSRSLGKQRKYLMYLPPGYAAAAARGERFPVMYLLHGSPGSPNLFLNAAALGVDLSVGVAHHYMRPFLLVMPDGRNGTFTSDTEWANSPKGRWEDYVLDVVRDVDARWPTLPDRRDRAIAGNSEGAYGALNISLHHLRAFSIAESWSGYYLQRARGPFKHATAAAIASNSPSLYVARVRAQLRRYPLRAYVYVGKHERELSKTRLFVRELAANGGHPTVGVFKGGHNWELWRREIPAMLAYAGHWFGRGR